MHVLAAGGEHTLGDGNGRVISKSKVQEFTQNALIKELLLVRLMFSQTSQ
jgi:hypothetical protein